MADIDRYRCTVRVDRLLDPPVSAEYARDAWSHATRVHRGELVIFRDAGFFRFPCLIDWALAGVSSSWFSTVPKSRRTVRAVSIHFDVGDMTFNSHIEASTRSHHVPFLMDWRLSPSSFT